ncbi:MAG: PilZ domain-containing protein [Candidatus Hydrogenedentes bacterium]|nr:PilZ domain-containing protein [Candidatus Hydrogenedentota bacterium]
MIDKNDKDWKDPYERRENRRAADRFSLRHQVSVLVDDVRHECCIVGPANLKDLSLTGALASTKHKLRPRQWVTLVFPTDCCPRHMGLPKVFKGRALVTRVEQHRSHIIRFGLRFSDDFVQNMDFALFINTLQTISKTLESRGNLAAKSSR